jgi:hypothetical protein
MLIAVTTPGPLPPQLVTNLLHFGSQKLGLFTDSLINNTFRVLPQFFGFRDSAPFLGTDDKQRR